MAPRPDRPQWPHKGGATQGQSFGQESTGPRATQGQSGPLEENGLAEAVARAAERLEARRAERAAMKIRRDHGLRARHAQKIARTEGADMASDQARAEQIKQGVGEAFHEWLTQHPVTVADVIQDAVKTATKEWLDHHGHELFGKEN